MAQTRYAPDRGLTTRMGLTVLAIGAVIIIIAGALYALGINPAYVLIFAVGLLFVQWYFSDKIALSASRARIVTPEEAPELHAIVDRLCQLADMPKPAVGIASSQIPNAFATGRSPQHSAVVVTTGLLERLDERELTAVLGHELSHIAHRDVTVMTMAAFAGILAQYAARMVFWGGGRSRDQNGAIVFLVVVAVGLIAQFVSSILMAMLSRYRELAADRAGAQLLGDPEGLASALVKVSDQPAVGQRDLRQLEPVQALCIAPMRLKGGIGSLFATHPPLEVRLDQLAKVARELGR